MVALGCPGDARYRKSRRGLDGSGRSTVHRIGLDTGLGAVRHEWIPKHSMASVAVLLVEAFLTVLTSRSRVSGSA